MSHLLITITLTLLFPALTVAQNDTVSCHLDFNSLKTLLKGAKRVKVPTSQECQYILQGLRLVQSQYLQQTGNFLPPLNSSESCWRVYQQLVDEFAPGFDILSTCGFQTSWISQGCMNITRRSQFENLVPPQVLNDTINSYNQSLGNNSLCAVCTTSCSRLQALYLTGSSIGSVSTCQDYPRIYAAAFGNSFEPTDKE